LETSIILAVTFVLTLANSIAIWFIFTHFSKRVGASEDRLKHINLDSHISEVFEGGVEDKNIHDLANELFRHVKTKYNLTAHSYNGLIKEISVLDRIGDDLKDDLIDFFEHMIVISYKKEGPHFEHEKEYLKAKLKIIIHFLEKDTRSK